jgi:hypothetical protein
MATATTHELRLDQALEFCVLDKAWAIDGACPSCPGGSQIVPARLLLTPRQLFQVEETCAGMPWLENLVLMEIRYRRTVDVERYSILKKCRLHPNEFRADPHASGCPVFQLITRIADSAPALERA